MDSLNQPNLPEGLASASEVYASAFFEGLRPDPDLLVWEWADKYRVLPQETSAEPGQWRTDRTPPLREIMEALSPADPCQEVDFAKGVQLGGTEVGNNWLGYNIDVSPGPGMLVMPTSNTAKRVGKTRVDKMVSSTPVLKNKVAEKRSRDAANTATLKEYPGGLLIIAGANSAAELSSQPVKFVFMDELDSYPDDVNGEGPPDKLAEKRTDTFVRKKIFKNSSVKGARGHSKIMRAFKRGDQRRYHVPCPHCAQEQVLVWEQMRWETRKVHEHHCRECGAIGEVADPQAEQHTCEACSHQAEGKAKERDTQEVISAHYECKHCHQAIPEFHKGEMLERGRWIAEAPGVGKAKSYHLSSLYSPLGWYSWLQAARDWVVAEADKTGRLTRTFKNTVLAEEYDEDETELAPDNLPLLAERYKQRTVPMGGLMLSAGVDVQKNRLEVVVKAWGRGEESWLIAYEVIHGDPLQDDVWNSLDDFLNYRFEHESGQKLQILATAIDSGYLAQRVYNFCMPRTLRTIFPTKGMGQTGKPVLGRPSGVEVEYGGRTIQDGVQLWPIGTDTAKVEIMRRLEVSVQRLPRPKGDGEKEAPEPAKPGPQHMHFPIGLPAEYYDQLTSERKVRKARGRGMAMVWEVETGRRNEALDCEVYAYAAAIRAGVHRANWDQLEAFFRQTRDLFVEAEKREEAERAARDEEQLARQAVRLASAIPPEVELEAAVAVAVETDTTPVSPLGEPGKPGPGPEIVPAPAAVRTSAKIELPPAAPRREAYIQRRSNWLKR